MRLARKLATATIVAAAGAVLMFAGPASAAVNFDAATGTGFVGKGDVQLAFGWNNAALQKNAGGVTFSTSSAATYSATCEWITEGKKNTTIHTVNHKAKTTVEATIAFDARVRNQITGFTLKGFGTSTVEGTIPVVGGMCPGSQGTDGEWIAVEMTSSTDSGLMVNYGAVSVSLPNTPVAVATAI
jgi:hypothetical protein